MSSQAPAPASPRLKELRQRRNPASPPVLAPTEDSAVVTDDEPGEAPELREPLRAQAHAPAHPPQREAAHEPVLRTRRRRLNNNSDIFYIPVDEIPEGSTYEWKRFAVMGQEDPFYVSAMREDGWEPVDPKRHPNWVPPGYSQPHIIKGGLILMERPVELTQEARREERQAAKRQVIDAEARLGMTPRGEMSRSADPRVAPRVHKEMMRPVIVAEEE